MIRFVCTCITPSNEILQSDILPRWAFCGWVLSTSVQNYQANANLRLAFIYDWLLFNESRNNIMDIEPCILLMHHSRIKHSHMTYRIGYYQYIESVDLYESYNMTHNSIKLYPKKVYWTVCYERFAIFTSQ